MTYQVEGLVDPSFAIALGKNTRALNHEVFWNGELDSVSDDDLYCVEKVEPVQMSVCFHHKLGGARTHFMTFAGLSVSVSTVSEDAALLLFWADAAIAVMLLGECVVSMRAEAKKVRRRNRCFCVAPSACDTRSHVVRLENGKIEAKLSPKKGLLSCPLDLHMIGPALQGFLRFLATCISLFCQLFCDLCDEDRF